MAKRHDDGDDDNDVVNQLRAERARLRIAYMVLYRQFLDLDDFCTTNHYSESESRQDG